MHFANDAGRWLYLALVTVPTLGGLVYLAWDLMKHQRIRDELVASLKQEIEINNAKEVPNLAEEKPRKFIP